MLKFLKENIIFFVGSILIIGFLVVTSLLKTMPSINENTSQTDATDVQVTGDTISTPNVDTKTTPPITPKPTQVPSPNTQTPQHFYNDDD